VPKPHPSPPLRGPRPRAAASPEADAAVTIRSARHCLDEAQQLERVGRLSEATDSYGEAIELARQAGAGAVEAEALRRLGVVRHHETDTETARELCERSYTLGLALGDRVLAAEALNAMAGMRFEAGAIEDARVLFHQAMELGGSDPQLRGRIHQNLGILANVQGDWEAARTHYRQSLTEFDRAGDERGCAIAYHNLGMIAADLRDWCEADRYFGQSLEGARRLGDVRLEGLCQLNHAEVHVARGEFDRARTGAEDALRIFDGLGSPIDKADAYRVIGVVYRETNRRELAEERLRTAMTLADRSGSVLGEAEAARELALLYRAMGRNQETLTLLHRSHRLFARLDARHDLVDVKTRVQVLESTYLAVVREWGQSIESADSYTFGHCERVASYGVAVAAALGLDQDAQKTIRLGAYLHDLGKVKVPHEILNKPGRLTPEEFAIIKLHPGWGVELLAQVDFPWDLKPIIRWHHERLDGTGYPDGLRGDQIPLSAQIICIVDVWDAVTTTRSYRPALDRQVSLARMEESRSWWRPEVYQAFLASAAGSPVSSVEAA